MKINKLILFFCLLIAFSLTVEAQKEVLFTSQNSEILQLARSNGLQKKIKSRAELERKIEQFVQACRRVGYLSFSVDSVIVDSSHYRLLIWEGTKITDARIEVLQTEQLLLQEARLSSRMKQNQIPLSDFPEVSEKLLTYLEEHGYPFAVVSLDSVMMEENRFSASFKVEKNRYITFDSIVLKGDAKLKKGFLYPYFGIRKDRPYNERIISRVPQKSREIQFATELLPAGVEFVEDRAYLYLFLNKKKMNRFDGYIGLVPVDERTGKIALAGELQLNLKNLFGVGESFDLLWRSPGRHSQYLKVHADFPFLFRTPIGISGDFMLDKTDTAYLSMNYLLGVQYTFANASFVKGFFDYTTSSLLSVASAASETALLLADYSRALYGVELYYRRLDYLYNPTKGIVLHFNLGAGTRKIMANNKLPESLYEGMLLQTVHYRVLGQLQGYMPLHKRWVFKLGARGGTLIAPSMVENELFKIGGMNSLRGFNEDEITASTYVIGTAELRFLFAPKAYFNLFFDGAWYEKNLSATYLSDFPFGFGLGVAFDTKAGLFYLSYALGKQLDNPISFKTGKIHFGLALNF